MKTKENERKRKANENLFSHVVKREDTQPQPAEGEEKKSFNMKQIEAIYGLSTQYIHHEWFLVSALRFSSGVYLTTQLCI